MHVSNAWYFVQQIYYNYNHHNNDSRSLFLQNNNNTKLNNHKGSVDSLNFFKIKITNNQSDKRINSSNNDETNNVFILVTINHFVFYCFLHFELHSTIILN